MVLAVLLGSSTGLLAQEAPVVETVVASYAISLGGIDFDHNREAAEVGFEVHFDALPWGVQPLAGVHATSDESIFVTAGVRRELIFGTGRNWAVVPGFAISYYEQGQGKDLGHEVEFRSGIDLVRRFEGVGWLGLGFYHLSNSSLAEVNPGSNSLLFRWLFTGRRR